MLAKKHHDLMDEGEAARLGTEIRESMARISEPSQGDVAKIGRLIDERIEASFNRGLRAALASRATRPASSGR